MELFRKNKSKHYWYDFTVRGQRYGGSTKETNETRAQKAAALKLAAAINGCDPLDRKPPTLREYAKDFLPSVGTGRLESDTRRYYRNGWRLSEKTKISGYFGGWDTGSRSSDQAAVQKFGDGTTGLIEIALAKPNADI